jgi:hypothetical protein
MVLYKTMILASTRDGEQGVKDPLIHHSPTGIKKLPLVI